MKLRIKMAGVAVYAVLAVTMFWAGGGVQAELSPESPAMAGETCPKGHAKG